MALKNLAAWPQLARVGLHLASGGIQTALVFPFLGSQGRDRMKQRWSRGLLSILRIETGPPAPSLKDLAHGLLVANHISFLDIFVINALLPTGFVAKDDIANWPLIGWLSRRNETVFIARGSRKAAQQTRQQMLDVLDRGRRLAIFPEGTTTDGADVLPFHGALFQSAIDAAVPVHVLAIRYLDRNGLRSTAPAYIDDVKLLDCLMSIFASGGLRAQLTLVASVQPPLPDRRHLAHQSHQAIANWLRRCHPRNVSSSSRNAAAISP